jgi:PAS domain S-box-containing protein
MTRPGTETDTRGTSSEMGGALVEHFERSPVGMFLLDADRRLLSANGAFSRLTGVNSSILAGSSLRRFLSSEAPLDLEDRIFEEVLAEGHWLGQVDFRSSLGETSPMLLSLTPVGAIGPHAASYVGAVAELGEQRWIEAESFRRAQDLAAFSAIAVATGSSTDPQEMLTMAARQVVEGLGVDACWIHRYDAEESRVMLVGEASYLNPSVRLSARLTPTAVNPAVLRALETRELTAESELLDRSIATIIHLPLLARGEVVGVVSILSVEGEKLSVREADLLRAVSYQIGTAVQNVRLVEAVRGHETELQEKNEQLTQLVERLRATDKMKSEFLANTSHELRTPLNSIIGFLDLVIEGVVTDPTERADLLRQAARSSRQLLHLINDVLDLARIEAGKLELEFEDLSLSDLVSGVVNTLRVQARKKKLALDSDLIPGELRITADMTRARQVLLNVVGNAVKFTHEGRVRIVVEETPGSPFVDVIVRDTGIGIPAGRRDFLFRKFSQADASTTRRYGGTGLGLAIVKELMEAMGGGVRVESPGENRGTAVTLTFARSGAAVPPGAAGSTTDA